MAWFFLETRRRWQELLHEHGPWAWESGCGFWQGAGHWSVDWIPVLYALVLMALARRLRWARAGWFLALGGTALAGLASWTLLPWADLFCFCELDSKSLLVQDLRGLATVSVASVLAVAAAAWRAAPAPSSCSSWAMVLSLLIYLGFSLLPAAWATSLLRVEQLPGA